ncbi:MAG: hypothetical protein ACREEY_06225 [Brevundimonas sp.]
MIEGPARSISTKWGEATVHVFPEKFPEERKPLTTARSRNERKFNIRIRQDDIFLLDALAKRQGVTRSALINTILHDAVRDELMSIEDLDARVLLASRADGLASYDDLAQPWVLDALGAEYRSLLGNVLETSNITGQPPEFGLPSGHEVSEEDYRSPAYLGLLDKLKGISE